MRWAAVAALGLALAGALSLALAAGPAARAASQPASDCAWHQHTKQVAKRVKRHGRVRRVTRRRHWWTCDRPAVEPSSGATPPALPGVTAQPPGEPEPTIARLGVKSFEYGYILSRPEVPAGEVIVELNNMGEDPHNLNLQLDGAADPPLEIFETGSQAHTTAHFTLPAGAYRLWCSLSEHDERGMHATLIVTG